MAFSLWNSIFAWRIIRMINFNESPAPQVVYKCPLHPLPPPSQGSLELHIGPMFSGKTSALRHRLEHFAGFGRSVLYLNHTFDGRSETAIMSTHSSAKSLPSSVTCRKTSDLAQESVHDFDVIGVDEAQFFSEDLIPTIVYWTDILGKTVIVSGLDGDAERSRFGYILDLIPHADSVTKHLAYCMECHEEGRLVHAPFSKKIACTKEQVDVGGTDKYRAVCRLHY